MRVSQTEYMDRKTGELHRFTALTDGEAKQLYDAKNNRTTRGFHMSFIDGTRHLLQNEKLNDADRTVFMALLNHMDKNNFLDFTRDQIAGETNRSPTAITRALKNLRASGVIHAWRRTGSGYLYRVDPFYAAKDKNLDQQRIAKEIRDHYEAKGGAS